MILGKKLSENSDWENEGGSLPPRPEEEAADIWSTQTDFEE